MPFYYILCLYYRSSNGEIASIRLGTVGSRPDLATNLSDLLNGLQLGLHWVTNRVLVTSLDVRYPVA
jgi:hypothetical protein